MVLRLTVGLLSLALTTTCLPNLDKLSDLSKKEGWVFLCYSVLNQILYIQGGRVDLVYPKEGEVSGLYHNYDTYPSLSPDRRYVAFVKQPPGYYIAKEAEPITIFDLQTRSQQALMHGLSDVVAPVWSPDGKEIAFVAKGKGRKNQSLYTIDLSGRQVIELTPGGGVSSRTPPSWSPDGKEIVFQTYVWDLSRSEDIVIVNRATKRLRRLDQGRNPSWSPRGDLIAYNQNDKDCYTIKPDGTEKKLLFSSRAGLLDAEDLVSPIVWSPDMRYVAYHKTAGMKGSDRRIYILDLRNKRKKQIYSGTGLEIVSWKAI